MTNTFFCTLSFFILSHGMAYASDESVLIHEHEKVRVANTTTKPILVWIKATMRMHQYPTNVDNREKIATLPATIQARETQELKLRLTTTLKSLKDDAETVFLTCERAVIKSTFIEGPRSLEGWHELPLQAKVAVVISEERIDDMTIASTIREEKW